MLFEGPSNAFPAGLEGSGLLNQHFLDHLERFIAKNVPATFLDLPESAAEELKAIIMSEAVKSFERKKKQFGSSLEKAAGRPMRVHVPGLQRKLRASQKSPPSDYLEIPRFFISWLESIRGNR